VLCERPRFPRMTPHDGVSSRGVSERSVTPLHPVPVRSPDRWPVGVWECRGLRSTAPNTNHRPRTRCASALVRSAPDRARARSLRLGLPRRRGAPPELRLSTALMAYGLRDRDAAARAGCGSRRRSGGFVPVVGTARFQWYGAGDPLQQQPEHAPGRVPEAVRSWGDTFSQTRGRPRSTSP